VQAKWWRVMVGLCLAAALAGPLLRSAEAADDLARSLTNLVERGNLAPRDGGVGDEPEMALAKSPAPAELGTFAFAPELVGPDFLLQAAAPTLAAVVCSPIGARRSPISARDHLSRLPILRF
jgi:hypothetical protein